MPTDYDKYAKTFAESRKNMKWAELEYFFSVLEKGSLLDIGCGSGRLIEQYRRYFDSDIKSYFGLDMSKGLIQEAQKSFPEKEFGIGDMLDVSKIIGEKKYDNIFLVASFHHLETLSQREDMMSSLYDACQKGGKIFMTNWALESSVHLEKYKDSKIMGSENKFSSSDFSIKFGEFDRFYHNFDLSELQFLAKKAGFDILENRIFDTQKNFITILQK